MNALDLPGLPPRRFPTSPAKLDSWRDCPRRYRWQNLDRPGVPARRWARTMMGSAAHLALRSWWADGLERIDQALDVVDGNWDSSLFKDQAQSSRAQDEVREWVRNYLIKEPHGDVLGVERTVSTMTTHLTISGRIDRIDQRGEEIVVVDYKTGRSELTDDDARTSMTLAIYADSVRRSLRRECMRVELHHLPTGSVASHEHTPASLARHLERADAIGAELQSATEAVRAGADPDEHFPATAGPLCGWCDFWSICPAGQAATSLREPWAGVDSSGVQISGGEADSAV